MKLTPEEMAENRRRSNKNVTRQYGLRKREEAKQIIPTTPVQRGVLVSLEQWRNKQGNTEVGEVYPSTDGEA